MRSVLVAVPVAALILAGCRPGTVDSPSNRSQQREKPPEQIDKVLRVKVASDGGIIADGQSVTLEQLSVKLAELKQADGEVLYYREDPTGEPTQNAMRVIQQVVKFGLLLRLSDTPDFSDSVDDQGNSRPEAK
jgi:biopolymer transport protein ExbD